MMDLQFDSGKNFFDSQIVADPIIAGLLQIVGFEP